MRVSNWAANMNAVITDNKTTEYVLGKWDCAIFTDLVVYAMTGKSHGKRFKGKYKTEIGYIRALKKQGFRDLKDYLTQCFGEPISNAGAWRGDLAFHEGCIGVNAGPFSIFIGVDSLGQQPIEGSNFIALHSSEVKEFFKVR